MVGADKVPLAVLVSPSPLTLIAGIDDEDGFAAAATAFMALADGTRVASALLPTDPLRESSGRTNGLDVESFRVSSLWCEFLDSVDLELDLEDSVLADLITSGLLNSALVDECDL